MEFESRETQVFNDAVIDHIDNHFGLERVMR